METSQAMQTKNASAPAAPVVTSKHPKHIGIIYINNKVQYQVEPDETLAQILLKVPRLLR